MGRVFTINSLFEVHLPAHHQRIFVILVTLASRNSSMSEMCTRIENVPGGTFSSSRNNVQKRRKTVYYIRRACLILKYVVDPLRVLSTSRFDYKNIREHASQSPRCRVSSGTRHGNSFE